MEFEGSTDPRDIEIRRLRLELAELRASAGTFGLHFEDRTEASEVDLQQFSATLALDPSRHVGSGEGPAHMLIEGENLIALHALRHSVGGRVDVIYIDPPYNTGNTRKSGFTYSDRFRSREDTERHSTWLSMMSRRLDLARDLLAPTGVIVISIDDNEVHHLRCLCDSTFGEGNFIAQLVWDGGNVKNNAKFISGTHEYLLIYARSVAAMTEAGVMWREPRPGVPAMLSQYHKLKGQHGDDHGAISAAMKQWVKTAPLEKRLKVFTDVDHRGLYTYADMSAPGGHGGRFEVLHPKTGLPCKPPSRGWAYTRERMDALIADDRVIFGADHSAQPMRKLYLTDKTEQVRRSILSYPARSSTHLIERMLGRRASFNNPKNLQMIYDLLALISPPDGLIVDFFAGSGTTGHATLALNFKDGGSRRFVLVTNNEGGICDTVTSPRLAAAVSGRWANGQKAVALGGRVLFARATLGRNESGVLEAIDGLVAAAAGREPATAESGCHAPGPPATFGWSGHGRKADAQRALDRFTHSNSGVLVLVPKGRLLDVDQTDCTLREV